MTLAVIPQMRLRKHGSLPSTSRTRSRAVVFLTVPSRCHPSRHNQDEVLSCELEATSDALERRKDTLRRFASIFRQVAHAREGGWGTDLPRFPPSGECLPVRARSSPGRSRMRPAPFWRHVRHTLADR
jgi:hypothetical protein